MDQLIQEINKKCLEYQKDDNEICAEIAKAMKSDLNNTSNNGVNTQYKDFLTKYIEFLKIKSEINTYTQTNINKTGRCKLFDYSFLDDVINNEYNLLNNITNVNKIEALYNTYTPFKNQNMKLYNLYNDYLYEGILASLGPYYTLLNNGLSNYKNMRENLILNLRFNLYELKKNIDIIETGNPNSGIYIKTLNKFRKDLNDNNVNKEKISTEYNKSCKIKRDELINNSLNDIDIIGLTKEFRNKNKAITRKYIEYFNNKTKNEKTRASVKSFASVRRSVKTVNESKNKIVRDSVAKGAPKFAPPPLIPFDEGQELLRSANKQLDDVDALLAEFNKTLTYLEKDNN